MRHTFNYLAVALLTLSANVNAASFNFVTDPFAGSDALTTPLRQIVPGEPFISFLVASDVYGFAPSVFGIDQILFANDLGAC